jgi:cytoskeletal protein CcmA (bactofilin family)
MLHSSDNTPKPQYTPSTPVAPIRPMTPPMEQATIGRTVVIKGEVTGGESLYIDGHIEGTITFKDHRVTIGRNGVVTANIFAREIVIMGKVTGNLECGDRVDIRSEGSLTGDIVTQRISVEDGALLRGAVQLTPSEHKQEKQEKPVVQDLPKALAAAAGKSN